ncbi:MAG: hypothetical protein JWO81_525 [Alphaproteobacteria bacterium]|nr:hypothetical protein [Alphaproteobacteria bacterium]
MEQIDLDQFEVITSELWAGGNHNPCKPPPYGSKHLEISSIYCYYLTPTGPDSYTKELYFWNDEDEITRDFVPGYLSWMVLNARHSYDIPPKVTLPVKWRKKSYIAFIVDDPDWKFADPGIVIYPTPTPNHAFFEGKTIIVPVDDPDTNYGTQQLSAFFCVNYMSKNDYGDNIDDGVRETFSFHLAFSQTAFDQTRGVRLGGETGTNMGPPVAPPGVY